MSSISPPGSPCRDSPPPSTKAHFVLELKYFPNKIILYECINLEDCLYNCLDNSGKKLPVLILLSKIAEIHVWNDLKSYKNASISAQILSAIKSLISNF